MRLRSRGTRIQRLRLATREPGRALSERATHARSASLAQRGQSIVEFALVAPLMIFLMFGIFDLARIYTTMMSVESAAREAADYGTIRGAAQWSDGSIPATAAEMERRACVAASDLPDFDWEDTDSDGAVDLGEVCKNPDFNYCLTAPPSTTCDYPVDSTAAGYDCHEPSRAAGPCLVKVTMSHDFQLFIPFQMDFFGVQLGLPVSLAFDRDSTFAMTDINPDATPSPGP